MEKIYNRQIKRESDSFLFNKKNIFKNKIYNKLSNSDIIKNESDTEEIENKIFNNDIMEENDSYEEESKEGMKINLKYFTNYFKNIKNKNDNNNILNNNNDKEFKKIDIKVINNNKSFFNYEEKIIEFKNINDDELTFEKNYFEENNIPITLKECMFTNLKFDSFRIILVCKHIISLKIFFNYIKNLILNGKYKIFCPILNNDKEMCNYKFEINYLLKLFNISIKNRILFKSILSLNYVKNNYQKYIFCQNCKNYTGNLKKEKNNILCFFCLKISRIKTNICYFCHNIECKCNIIFKIPNKKIRIGDKKFNKYKNCPNCNIVIELIGANLCLKITCLQCNFEFDWN